MGGGRVEGVIDGGVRGGEGSEEETKERMLTSV